MSISMGDFGATGQFPSHDSYGRAGSRPAMSGLHCRGCGFEPADAVTPPRGCPRCGGHAFERVPVPGSLLAAASAANARAPRPFGWGSARR